MRLARRCLNTSLRRVRSFMLKTLVRGWQIGIIIRLFYQGTDKALRVFVIRLFVKWSTSLALKRWGWIH